MAKKTAQTKQPATRNANKRSAWWQSLWLWAIVGVVVLAVLGVLLVQQTATNSAATLAGLQSFSGQQRGHTTDPVQYQQIPPVGGMHNPAWQNCGIYDAPIANENGVHTLEHGAVWITYQPELPPATVDALRALVRGRQYTLLSPFPGLPAPVVASAWGLQLKVDDVADPRLARFLATYIQGPQTPEPGASCVGGIGQPIDS
ncbi:MAG: DUF3105 domain-containing protein [Anaerolineales bacterium]|nr:DUF3105 domain-containing protein [Anaerolineales bacterium]